MKCPKCGFEQADGNTECASLKCGIVFPKYEKIRREREDRITCEPVIQKSFWRRFFTTPGPYRGTRAALLGNPFRALVAAILCFGGTVYVKNQTIATYYREPAMFYLGLSSFLIPGLMLLLYSVKVYRDHDCENVSHEPERRTRERAENPRGGAWTKELAGLITVAAGIVRALTIGGGVFIYFLLIPIFFIMMSMVSVFYGDEVYLWDRDTGGFQRIDKKEHPKKKWDAFILSLVGCLVFGFFFFTIQI